MDGRQTFGGRLEAALRLRRVPKMYALAVTIGVDESAISRWRRGRPISTRNLVKLCEALDLSIDWLLTGRGPMQPCPDRENTWHEILTQKFERLEPAEATRLAEILHIVGTACEMRSPVR